MKKTLIVILLAVVCLGLCAVGAQAATMSGKDAIKQLSAALGNKYSILNANKMTGAVGMQDYIETKLDRAALEAYIAEKKPASRELLDWFKTAFLENKDNNLSSRDKGDDKGGIRGVFVAKYKEICYAISKKETTDALKSYKADLPALVKTRATAIKACDTAYAQCAKNLTAEEKNIKIESCKNDKEICANNAYTAYYNDVKNKYHEKLEVKLSNLQSCLNDDRITNWQWAQ